MGNIMFGPDICGYSTKKVHVIFNYKGKNLLVKKEPTAETDQLSHVYTLLVKPDNTYEVFVDGESKQKGSLEEDWDFLEPRKIKDPEQSKPDDWVDDAKMDDPEDVKPEGWDDIAKQIDDPEVDNPDFVEDDELYMYESFGVVGIDIWQVKAGSIFDNIFLGDSLEEAQEFMKETYTKNKDAEKEMFDKAEEERRAKEEEERKKEEEERKAREAEEEEDEEDEDEDEDEEEEEATPEKEEL